DSKWGAASQGGEEDSKWGAASQGGEEDSKWGAASQGGEGRQKDRTLTNLYNGLNVWRGREAMKVKPDAADFAPRLADLHDALDRAVCAAYGWPETILADEDEMLRRLLALNLARAG
ncbi:MAG: hypothetical protein JNM70_23095, partial [Anaerolineae bacterium]|nr:hypothetical protein [Anaerolineae bacterium]